MEPIECPQCGTKEISIFEDYDMFRRYTQEGNRIDPDSHDEESSPKGAALTYTCMECEHEWVSEDAILVIELILRPVNSISGCCR